MTTKPSFCAHRPAGFSLVELMVVIAMLAITASLAGPPMTQWIQSNRVTSSANSLMADLKYARTEAIRNNRPVFVAPRSGDFKNGWTVYTETSAGVQDTVLKVHRGFADKGLKTRYIAPAPIHFRQDGTQATTDGLAPSVTITIADADPNRCDAPSGGTFTPVGCSARIIEIRSSGRASITNPNPFL